MLHEIFQIFVVYLIDLLTLTNSILKYVGISENNFKAIIYARSSAKHCTTQLHLKETLFLFTTRHASINVYCSLLSISFSLTLWSYVLFYLSNILTCPMIRFLSPKCGSFLPKLSLNVYFVRNQHHLLWIKRVFLQTFKMIFPLDSYLLAVTYVASVWFMVS